MIAFLISKAISHIFLTTLLLQNSKTDQRICDFHVRSNKSLIASLNTSLK